MGKKIFLGIDLGSISSKYALVDEKGTIIRTEYQRHKGQPLMAIFNMLKELFYTIPMDEIHSVAVTGTAGKKLADLLGVEFINEVIAHTRSVVSIFPNAKTIIDVGGEDSKLILLERDANTGDMVVADFAMNSKCAAGTGSFLDQQASRLGISIENEFGELALLSKNPPRIAGRCSVFAKSDMIHLQQKATPMHDIVAGLCFALARNFKGNIGKGKVFEKPVIFQGGVAANKGMVKAFQRVLELEPDELVIPEHFAVMGAIGSAIVCMEKCNGKKAFKGIGNLEDYFLKRTLIRDNSLPSLQDFQGAVTGKMTADAPFDRRELTPGEKLEAYLGVDVGSVSTNVVVMDNKKRVLSKRYLWTAGNPIKAVMTGLEEVGQEVAEFVDIKGVCTTGSGRYMIGDFIGADVVKNEITAQARAASEIDVNVDTVFEIGGQDSKYISLRDGVIIDFEMNKACAAGTGSFLEEQAERLDISIKEEFGDMACGSKCPSRLGENCTVFMESSLNYQQQQGAPKDDLVAGLAYSIVYNYLNRVVGRKTVGNVIFFQGGVAYNKSVVAAFEKVTGKKITVPEHHEVTGAIGCCLIAMENVKGQTSRFKGFDLSKRAYQVTSFTCQECSNLCEINRVKIEGEKSLFYGSRCEKYDVDRDAKEKYGHIPDLFKERMELLMNVYPDRKQKEGAVKIGIPRALFMMEYLPYWKAFLSELGFEVVVSDDTTKTLVLKGLEAVVAEPCYPVKVGHGHVINLMEKGVRFIFHPCIMDFASCHEGMPQSFTCHYAQALSYMIEAAIGASSQGVKIMKPVIRFRYGTESMVKALHKEFRRFGINKNRIRRALSVAEEYQNRFMSTIRRRGEEVLKQLKPEDKVFVITGRSYNTCDSGVNLEIGKKLRNLGRLAIPIDFLTLPKDQLQFSWPNMNWMVGQRIMSAAKMIRNNPNLYAIYITNFACAPDSFIGTFFRNEMAGKPYLQLEIDEHSADAGAITRCEAFFDSLENAARTIPKAKTGVTAKTITQEKKRTIYIPYMGDHAFALKAALVANGVPAEVIPETDEVAIEYGRQYTCGKECYPATITTGDMVKIILDPATDRSKVAFFMPSGSGSCRIDKYNLLQRLVLRDLGYEDIPIYSPDQTDRFYEDLGIVGSNFVRLVWQGIIAVDFLDKLLRETRPYEINKGETERIYGESLNDIYNTLVAREDVFKSVGRAIDRFGRVSMKRTPRPIIGLVGEIFVRSSRYANDNIVRKIEELGGEAWLATTGEWFLYLNEHVKMRNLRDKEYSKWLLNYVQGKVMNMDEHHMMNMFKGKIKSWEEPGSVDMIRIASPYLTPDFDGESIVSIGRAVEFIRHGASGIINLIPFTCMPGVIVNSIYKKVREDYPEAPYLELTYDAGSDPGSHKVRLEAFMYQALQHKQVMLKTGRWGKIEQNILLVKNQTPFSMNRK